jgi:hypothetical protein
MFMTTCETETLASHSLPHFKRIDRFEEWLHAPAPLESTHPRFDVRRVLPEEFEAVYRLVNETFGVTRSHLQLDWIYRRNPYGMARCWAVFERESGRLVSSSASWPWPLARGTYCLEGVLDGDSVVAPGWQRQGIDRLRAEVGGSHPWEASTIALSWPNEKSRGAVIKRGRGARVLGPVPKAVLMLNAGDYLAERAKPAGVGAAFGRAVDLSLIAWRRFVLGHRTGMTIEALRRFESSHDEVTQRCTNWPGFWSPHAADFLNWRYLEHPTAHYLAFALVEGSAAAGYYVLKIDGEASWLMEFVAPVTPRHPARALLLHAIETARGAGCIHLMFSAPPGWRHWKLLRAAGFLPLLSGSYFWPAGEDPELSRFTMWQWVPGDMDFL